MRTTGWQLWISSAALFGGYRATCLPPVTLALRRQGLGTFTGPWWGQQKPKGHVGGRSYPRTKAVCSDLPLCSWHLIQIHSHSTTTVNQSRETHKHENKIQADSKASGQNSKKKIKHSESTFLSDILESVYLSLSVSHTYTHKEKRNKKETNFKHGFCFLFGSLFSVPFFKFYWEIIHIVHSIRLRRTARWFTMDDQCNRSS